MNNKETPSDAKYDFRGQPHVFTFNNHITIKQRSKHGDKNQLITIIIIIIIIIII